MTRTQHWQEAFKFALALGLSYMAALSMNWTHPLWAAFSVMTCSLATAGASLERGILRLAGTLAGSALGIVLVSLVGHSPWLMFSVELIIIMVCTAGAVVSRFWHAWIMIAFVNVLVFSDAYPYWELSFDVGVERTSETALGIVMYMLVSSLLWPRYTGESLERCVTSIWKQVIRLYDLTRSERESGEATAKFEGLRSELITTAAIFDETLPAAIVDTPSLHGRRTAWHAWRAELAVFVNALTLWQGSFRHVRGLPLNDLVPEHRELELLVKDRLASASRLWQSPTDRLESTEPGRSTPPPEPSSRRGPRLALVNKNSFWVSAFFRETLMENVKPGYKAVVRLMAYADRPIEAEVESVGWGIAMDDGQPGYNLLPRVRPTFEWIRLAQRIPVRIRLGDIPEGVELRVGTTATVIVLGPE